MADEDTERAISHQERKPYLFPVFFFRYLRSPQSVLEPNHRFEIDARTQRCEFYLIINGV